MSLAPAPTPTPSLPETALRYAFLLGRGRSGTTWIGQILNRFAGCHYKYEPFDPDKIRRPLAIGSPTCPHGDDADLRRRFEALMRPASTTSTTPRSCPKPCRSPARGPRSA